MDRIGRAEVPGGVGVVMETQDGACGRDGRGGRDSFGRFGQVEFHHDCQINKSRGSGRGSVTILRAEWSHGDT